MHRSRSSSSIRVARRHRSLDSRTMRSPLFDTATSRSALRPGLEQGSPVSTTARTREPSNACRRERSALSPGTRRAASHARSRLSSGSRPELGVSGRVELVRSRMTACSRASLRCVTAYTVTAPMIARSTAPTPMIASSWRWRRSDARFWASSSRVGLVLGPPREHRLREHVVEDLVPDLTALLERAQDSAARQLEEHRLHLRHRDVAELGEVGGVVRDLRPRRCHEVVEEPGCDVLLVLGELRHRAFEMLFDDVLRTPETLERRSAQLAGARSALLLPDALHHELEVRRLDPRRRLDSPSTAPSPPSAGSIWPAPTSSRTRSTSSGSTATTRP